ncbi:hypothetical protein B0G57_10541 [Trinickia symbiotica]|uniref:Uncharacterized protein n=1 Tax=Trinickia symbiotica TaxID=863227 RepID=A0A2N7X539_9BURK|nr:hypothetical protein [Trinickia symbiotica]PMS36879.1 hypothetical protein C0Z20_09030 [Trinickia symbiotica]PPK45335.1 hypothetical protein B0G57_10541 [Trinickia symbiotica]
MKLVRYSANVLVTIVIGGVLSRYVSGLPYEFPPLPASIAFVMRKLGIDTVKNADDVETIGLLVIIVASFIVAAVLVWALNRLLRRWQLGHG